MFQGDVLSYEEERKLKMVAARRLVIIDGIYKVCHAMRLLSIDTHAIS